VLVFFFALIDVFFFLSKERLVIGCGWYTNCLCVLVVTCWLIRVFRHLRELFYMLAICGSDTLREMSSPGKSGSIFYLTQDDRFIIKTVKKSKVKVSWLECIH